MYNVLNNAGICKIATIGKCKFRDCSWSILKRYYAKEKFYPRRIISGIQPTGQVHLGNYLGAIKRWVDLQNTEENPFWFVADMHAVTLPQNPKVLWENVLKMCATLLACGIDPNRSTLFQQSKVGMHGELCWTFSTLLMTNRLTHLHHYKEKAKTSESMLHGLLSYPILQTADILLYKATHVPVGQDQIEHVQLVQHLAQKFNSTYSETFPMSEALIAESGNRVKSLREPSKKMSKSSLDIRGRIELIDEPDVILRKIKRAVTDFTSNVTFDEQNRPGVSNLVTIHSLMTGKSVEEVCQEAKDLDTGKYKLLLADVVIEKLRPIREKYMELMNQQEYLEKVLEHGTEKARIVAEICMREVHVKIGQSAPLKKKEKAGNLRVAKPQ